MLWDSKVVISVGSQESLLEGNIRYIFRLITRGRGSACGDPASFILYECTLTRIRTRKSPITKKAQVPKYLDVLFQGTDN